MLRRADEVIEEWSDVAYWGLPGRSGVSDLSPVIEKERKP
jgi:hypothetical protein